MNLRGRFTILIILIVTCLLLTCSKKEVCYVCKQVSMRYALHPVTRTDGLVGPDQIRENISFHCDMSIEEINQYEKEILSQNIQYIRVIQQYIVLIQTVGKTNEFYIKKENAYLSRI